MHQRRWFLCLVLLLMAARARAEEVAEPASGQKFATQTTVKGRPYSLVGLGMRKKFVIKVYAMALYVDKEGAKPGFESLVNKAGGKDRAKLTEGDRAQSFVVHGHFGKYAVLHFVRDVDKGAVQDAYKDSLAGALAAPELQKDAQAFIALFDRDMREGQQIRLHTDESGKISIEIAGQKKEGPQNPRLCREIWSIWLGAKPIDKSLRKALVDRIDELAR